MCVTVCVGLVVISALITLLLVAVLFSVESKTSTIDLLLKVLICHPHVYCLHCVVV